MPRAALRKAADLRDGRLRRRPRRQGRDGLDVRKRRDPVVLVPDQIVIAHGDLAGRDVFVPDRREDRTVVFHAHQVLVGPQLNVDDIGLAAEGEGKLGLHPQPVLVGSLHKVLRCEVHLGGAGDHGNRLAGQLDARGEGADDGALEIRRRAAEQCTGHCLDGFLFDEPADVGHGVGERGVVEVDRIGAVDDLEGLLRDRRAVREFRNPPFTVHLGQRGGNVLLGSLRQLGRDPVRVDGVCQVQFVVEDVFDAGRHHPRGAEDEHPLVRFPGHGRRLGQVLACHRVVVLVAAACEIEVFDHRFRSCAPPGRGREEHGGVIGVPRALVSALSHRTRARDLRAGRQQEQQHRQQRSRGTGGLPGGTAHAPSFVPVPADPVRFRRRGSGTGLGPAPSARGAGEGSSSSMVRSLPAP